MFAARHGATRKRQAAYSRGLQLDELAGLGSLLDGVEATQRLDVIGRRDHRSLLATHDTNKVSSPPN